MAGAAHWHKNCAADFDTPGLCSSPTFKGMVSSVLCVHTPLLLHVISGWHARSLSGETLWEGTIVESAKLVFDFFLGGAGVPILFEFLSMAIW